MRNPDLAAVGLQLLLLPFGTGKWHSTETVQGLEPRSWAQCATKKCNGRLHAGCCHVGCTDTAGVSAGEAALVTLLCCGCRRVRYCGKACQRAAWVAAPRMNLKDNGPPKKAAFLVAPSKTVRFSCQPSGGIEVCH